MTAAASRRRWFGVELVLEIVEKQPGIRAGEAEIGLEQIEHDQIVIHRPGAPARGPGLDRDRGTVALVLERLVIEVDADCTEQAAARDVAQDLPAEARSDEQHARSRSGRRRWRR